jgi:putative membrane-bound dehydrogenase-like protein
MTHYLRVTIVSLLPFFALLPADAALTNFSFPPGFKVLKAAGAPEIQFPMFACFDDKGRLYVAESSGLDLYKELQNQTRKCRVSVLEDKDGDGVYESAQVFGDKLVFPMGLAWRDGKLYVADPPDLVTLEDTNGDLKADVRKVVLTGFGHKDNGSLHGLVFGPDGWLYMTMGQPDGYNLKRPGLPPLVGTSGALIRSRPDGTEPQVLSRGFENLVEIAFLPSGEIIGTDNWYSLPTAGIRDGLVHLVDGGLYPTSLNDTGTVFPISGAPLPAVSLYPAVAHSGMVRYLGSSFPQDYRNTFFSAQHNTRKIVRHRLNRNGSTFVSEDEDFLTSNDPDFHPSDVLEDADGSLLVLDTGSWYVDHCPTGRIRKTLAKGGIYRVTRSQAPVMKDPWGKELSWSQLTAAQLVERLQDARPAVSERARELLAEANVAIEPELRKLLLPPGKNDFTFAKENGIWALSRTSDSGAGKLLRDVVSVQSNPGLRALAARALGNRNDREAEPLLVQALKDPSPEVRMASAEALATCGSDRIVPEVIQALERSPDRFLEHALFMCLYRHAGEKALQEAVTSANPFQRKAALLLLDQRFRLAPETVLSSAFSEAGSVREAAFQILKKHPEWGPVALSNISLLLQKQQLTSVERVALREFLSRFYRDEKVAELMALKQQSPAAQEITLEVMTKAGAAAHPSWGDFIGASFNHTQLIEKSVAAASALQAPQCFPALEKIALGHAEPTVRFQAIRGLARARDFNLEKHFGFLLGALQPARPYLERLAAAEILASCRLTSQQLERFVSAVANDRNIPLSTVLTAATKADLAGFNFKVLLDYLTAALQSGFSVPIDELKKITGTAPASIQQQFQQLAKAVEDRHKNAGSEIESTLPLLSGGDPNRGHSLFLTKAACANCHRVGQTGGVIGPDLTKIGAIRSGRDLIESLIAPSSTFAQGYETWEVVLKSGEVLQGIRVRQADEAFVLRGASGGDMPLRREDIQSVQPRPVSVMPEGLMGVLTEEEKRDLLAYLQQLK